MFSATKEFKFEAAHRLVGHKGLCRHIHGHSFRVQVTLATAALNGLGMVMDFSDIKALINDFINNNLDHALILNSVDPLIKALQRTHDVHPPRASGEREAVEDITNRLFSVPFNPTSENMARFFFEKISSLLQEKAVAENGVATVWVKAVTLFETNTSFATYQVQ